jgi:hypothetical protein
MAKIQLLFIFLQRNNGLTRQNLTHKNTSLSNAVYSIAQLRVLSKLLEISIGVPGGGVFLGSRAIFDQQSGNFGLK